jgi:ATP-binding cassette, subfamily B, bacterial
MSSLPEGYDRQVGEQGSHLSGGQQQRLIIARALVEHPDVLILDEPTSSLDVRSEHLIRQTLEGLRERMTIIIIAHRLSTLDSCDRLMVIHDGELKGFDTPDNLEKDNDFYREAAQALRSALTCQGRVNWIRRRPTGGSRAEPLFTYREGGSIRAQVSATSCR